MPKKRERLDVIHDILKVIQDNNNSMKPTRLLYASNLSPQMFKDYLDELTQKKFIIELQDGKKKKYYSLTDKGFEFLQKYQEIRSFIENFGL